MSRGQTYDGTPEGDGRGLSREALFDAGRAQPPIDHELVDRDAALGREVVVLTSRARAVNERTGFDATDLGSVRYVVNGGSPSPGGSPLAGWTAQSQCCRATE